MPVTGARRAAVGLALAVALGGCASAIAQRGFEEMAAAADERLGQRPVWVRSEDEAQALRRTVEDLMARPLDADAAVKLALVNNRALQAAYAEIGVGAADLAAASRPPNPSFGFSRLANAGGVELEYHLAVDVLGLLTFPFAEAVESRRFEQTKLRATHEVLRVAAQARRAWFEAVAAGQAAAFIAQVREAAATQAELAQRLNRVGNIPALDYAREQAFYADAAMRLARAQLRAGQERERLTRLMGLWGNDAAFQLPERLPDIPEVVEAPDDIEAKAVADRLDIRLARADVDGLRRALGLTRATRFINVLEAGPAWSRDPGEPRRGGFEIALEVPIFDFGDSKVAKAENLYLAATNRLAQTAINARSEVREAYLRYRTAHELARHYATEIVPLRQRISEEVTLRYNGMLVSVFELLSDAREQLEAVVAAIEAQRDFWIAETDLRFALIADTGPGAMVAGPAGAPGSARKEH